MYRRIAMSILMTSWLILSVVYYNNVYNMFQTHNMFNLNNSQYHKFYYRLPLTPYNGTEDFLINTPGCYIPNYSKTLQFKEPKKNKLDCGKRAIFVEQVTNHSIKFNIDKNNILNDHKKINEEIECCYRFAKRSTASGNEDNKITYSSCKPFNNGSVVKLEEEFLTVRCYLTAASGNSSEDKLVYEDAYLILKKLERNVTKLNKKQWNILILGMDTVSRARLFNSMPETVRYLKQHNWLDYRGYQKVGSNTFPNIMAFMTGKNVSSVYKRCANGMHTCNDDIIWSKFQNAGYVTAYGEDFLTLPDTFSRFNGFKTPPTNHYTRPFFLTGESSKGNYICAKKKPSANHLLEYAVQLANAYKKESFFGMFWLNSYSHNLDNLPTLIDKGIVNLFEEFNNIGVLNNTFIIFLSDHGIRFGKIRESMESYFEERLPMFFMWTPPKFRELFPEEYHNLEINQNRLTTPYDLYMTLGDILKISSYTVEETESQACPQCTSMFEEKSPFRTCVDTDKDESWCTCHNMTHVNNNVKHVKNSLDIAVSYIQNKTQSVPTITCMACIKLKLKTVLRIHYYYDKYNDNTYYIIAFVMSPGDVAYEVVLWKSGDQSSVKDITESKGEILLTSTISPYNVRGSCVKNRYDRAYCVCKKDEKCKNKQKKG